MNPTRHDQLKAARRLLLQNSLDTRSRSKSPDCVWIQRGNATGSIAASPKMFVAPNRYRSISPAGLALSAPPPRRKEESERTKTGSRQPTRAVRTVEREGAPLRRKHAVPPPPPRPPYTCYDDVSIEESPVSLPFQDVIIHKKRSSSVPDASCDHEQNSAFAKYLPSHCDKNGHCIRHAGLLLYKRHGSHGFAKVRDSCPLCMIDQNLAIKGPSRPSERSKSSSARARSLSAPRKSSPLEVEETRQHEDPYSVLARLERHTRTATKERLEKKAFGHNDRFQSAHRPVELRPSSSSDKYSSVEKKSKARHRDREQSHTTRSVSDHTVERLSHILHKLEKISPSPSGPYVDIATRSTCSSSYLSDDISTDLISEFADLVSEYEKRKSSASISSRSHHRRLKFNSEGRFISCTDYSCVSRNSRESSSNRDSFVSGRSRASSRSRGSRFPFDSNGCCNVHPSVILAVKKPFVKEWCIVQGACPLCVSDEAMDFTYQRRPTISSIPSLF